MATKSRGRFLDGISAMLPKNPGGPPVPPKKLIDMLKRLREQLDKLIANLESQGKDKGKGKKRPAKRKPAASKATAA